jgi:hypothetical protein
MKYWAFFAGKLALIWGIAVLLKKLLLATVPIGAVAKKYGHQPFAHDLTYTTAMLVYTLVCIGLVALAILDQKYRCRTCLSRLRMPVHTGSWGRATIFSPPKTEYICPYGHGTMKEKELKITGRETPDWVEHKDIWEELESLKPK